MKYTLIISLLFALLLSSKTSAQCDFVNDIIGLSQTTMPTGNAADPLLYTHTYVLVDVDGNIVATSTTPDFTGLNADLYYLHAVNYINTESAAIVPLLAVGASFNTLEAYAGCINISDPYGNCSISVCDEITVLENTTLVSPATGFTVVGHENEYCLVCNGIVQDMNSTGTFDLSLYPAATAGADCQVVSVNYQTPGTAPVTNGDNWNTIAAGNCNLASCWDYLGRNLVINSTLAVELIEFSGHAESTYNKINWETNTETNSSHFVLSRSVDGINFIEINQSPGQGTTTQNHRYQYDDFEISEELYYYRLKSVDFDGSYQLSQILAISRGNAISDQLIVYPIPSNDYVNILFQSTNTQMAQIELRSIDGKLILRKNIDCKNGLNTLNLNVSDLAQGVYQVNVMLIQENRTLTTKILK